MNTLIKIDQLHNKYTNQIITDLTFECGSINVLVGRSGSGKSTFIKHILNQDQVIVNSSNVIGYVPQNRGLFLHKTILENLAIIGEILNTEFDEDTLAELLEVFDLTKYRNQKVVSLSGGQRTKVAIIRALFSASEVIILDEPLSDLDEISKNELIAIFIQLRDKYHKCLIVISHDLNNILKVANKIIIFNVNQVFQYLGPLDKIINYLE